MEMTALKVSRKQEITDESIAAGNVNDCVLLLTYDAQAVQYAALDTARDKFIALRDYRIHSAANGYQSGSFQQVMEKDTLVKDLHPRKKIFSLFSPCTVLVPGPLFNRDNTSDYLKLASSTETQLAFSDKLRFSDVHVVYSVPSFLVAEVEASVGEVTLFNAVTAFIDQQLMINKHNNETAMAVNIRHGYMDIVMCKGSSLLFSNSFPWQNAEDFIYYLLFSMEQLQVNPDQQEVLLFGDIERTSASWMVSRKYIRNVNPGTRPEGAGYSYGFSKVNAHQYYTLFSQQLCVS